MTGKAVVEQPAKELLWCKLNGRIEVLVPKRRGTGFLRVPLGHKNCPLSGLALDCGVDIVGLDGCLEIYGMGLRRLDHEGLARVTAEVLPKISELLGFPLRQASEPHYWANHPLEQAKAKAQSALEDELNSKRHDSKESAPAKGVTAEDIAKHFRLKKPCKNCPFLREGAIELMPGRVEGIVQGLITDDNSSFPCHKTTHGPKGGEWVDVDDDDEGGDGVRYIPSGHEAMCGGAAAYLMSKGRPNVAMRIGFALGVVGVNDWDEAIPLVIE